MERRLTFPFQERRMDRLNLAATTHRAHGPVPTTHPYAAPPTNHTGGGTVAPAVLASADTDDAIVDRVLLELRDAATPTMVLRRRDQ